MTAKEIYLEGVMRLKEKNIENAEFDAAQLFEHHFGFEITSVKAEGSFDDNGFTELIERRAGGYPLQYLLGEWEFYGIPVKVGEGVLIPRQDTEALVEAVIKKNRTPSPVVIDLCSGSGCIALALEKYLRCSEVYAVEKSEEAAGYLRENVKMNGSAVKLVMGDVLGSSCVEIIPDCDLIVCNPPYLTGEDMERLQKEVTHEPEEALFGGEDGLDFYRTVTRIWKNRLKTGGMLIYEIGIGQEDDVMQIMVQHGFENVRCKPDPCGIMRCVMGTKR